MVAFQHVAQALKNLLIRIFHNVRFGLIFLCHEILRLSPLKCPLRGFVCTIGEVFDAPHRRERGGKGWDSRTEKNFCKIPYVGNKLHN